MGFTPQWVYKMSFRSLIVVEKIFGFSASERAAVLVLRDADLVTLKGGVGVTQGKCWVKDLSSIRWNPHCAIF